MPITFPVDHVQPVLTRLPGQSLRERFPNTIDSASDAGVFVDTGHVHPLIAAVHLAFSEHRPLALSPDAVWLTIAQGFAQHVRLNSGALRDRFVRHSGKKALKVIHSSPELPESFEPIIEQFRDKLAEELGPGMVRLMMCDFSTTTDIERTASAVILMDTFQPYFNYILMCICGIPSITVLGTEQDWRMIGERVRILGEYDLTWWTSHVEKIVEHLRQAAAGKPDVAFFRRIYKPGHAYGGDVVTGWIARLYPYIKNEGIFDRRNPILAIDGEEIDRGLRTDETMPGFSRTKLIVEAQGQPTRKLDLVAGLAGVAQRDDGSVEARAAWFVEESVTHIDELIEELRKHRLPERASDRFPPLEGPAEIIALYSRFDGGTLPFGWSLRPVRKFEECFHQIEPSYYNGPVNLTVFADLPDDSMLAFAYTHIESGPHWGILHLPPQAISEKSMVCAESDVAWVGNSIAEVLLRGFETNGEDVGMRRGVPSPTLRDFTNYSRTTGR